MCLVNCNVLSSVGMIRMTNSMTRMFCCLISTRLTTSSPRFLLSSYTLIPLTWQGNNSTFPTKLIVTTRRSVARSQKTVKFKRNSRLGRGNLKNSFSNWNCLVVRNMEWNQQGKRLFLRRNWVSSWFSFWLSDDCANIPNVKDTSGVF